MARVGGKAHQRAFLAVALALVAALAFGAAPAVSAQTLEDIAVRDQLIADQEALLNAYRCLFDTDTQLVPGECRDANGAEDPVETPPTTEPPAEDPVESPYGEPEYECPAGWEFRWYAWEYYKQEYPGAEFYNEFPTERAWIINFCNRPGQ